MKISYEQNVQHTDSDHESEVIERSLTSTSSLVVSESEERHDRHNGSVFDNDEATVIDNDEATVIDAVTNQSTTASSLTENRDSEDVDTFDSIVSREIGEREDDLRDDISDLSTDDTLRNTAAEENFTQTQVGSNASNVCQSPTQEGPDHSNTIDQRDNRPDEDYDDDEVINPSIYHIMERYLGDPVLSQFRGLYYFSTLRSKLTRDWLRINGNPRSVRCETCTQSYIMPYRRHSNSANTKLGCHNVARLRNYVCQSKRIPFAHPNALPRLSTERLRTDLLRIFDHTESQDTATDESDEQDSSSSDSSDDSGSSPDRNNTLLESNNSSPPPERERETLTEPEMGGSIFDSSGESTSNQEHFHTMVPDQALITLEREETRPTVESDESILAAAATNCDNQSSPTNSINNNNTCVSDYFQKQLDMLSPYQLEKLTSLVNADLVLLERKYRAIPNLEAWESSTNDSSPSSLASEGLTTATNTNSSRSDSEDIRNSPEISHSRSDSEISDSGLLLARMRRHVTFTPDTVFENRRTSKEYRTFTKQQRRLLRKSTPTNLFGNILFEMNNWQNSHLSPQPSRRVVIRPGNYT